MNGWLKSAVLLVALLLALPSADAGAAETLGWEDLSPPFDESRNPVPKLPQPQQDDVYSILWGPNYGEPKSKWNKEETESYDRLRAAGVDPEKLFGEIESLRKELEKNDNTLVFDLDKKTIRLPGYVLPLDFDGKQVKSFLLVPSVGACIHVPPPPPNQIVHVTPDKPFVSEELFAPVWVTGEITVGMGRKSLSLVDGSSDIDFGYSMKATKIEPYKGE